MAKSTKSNFAGGIAENIAEDEGGKKEQPYSRFLGLCRRERLSSQKYLEMKSTDTD
jgi:hypothetical protein